MGLILGSRSGLRQALSPNANRFVFWAVRIQLTLDTVLVVTKGLRRLAVGIDDAFDAFVIGTSIPALFVGSAVYVLAALLAHAHAANEEGRVPFLFLALLGRITTRELAAAEAEEAAGNGNRDCCQNSKAVNARFEQPTGQSSPSLPLNAESS